MGQKLNFGYIAKEKSEQTVNFSQRGNDGLLNNGFPLSRLWLEPVIVSKVVVFAWYGKA